MPTIYDQLLDQQAPAPGAAPPSDNPYDAILDQQADEQRKRLQLVLQDAVKTSPEAAASAQQLAKQTGLPVATVERNLEEVRQRALVQRINTERLQASSPVLARQLMDPEFAKLAHDDIDSMVEAERTLGGFAQDVGVTALKGAVGLPQAFVGLADIATLGYAGKGLEALGIRFNETQDILNGMYSTAQQRANTRVQEADGFFNTLGAMAANPSTIATTVGESLPQMIGGAGIARGLLGLGARGVAAGMMGPELPGILARTLGSAAPVAAGAAGEGLVGAGSAAEQFRADNPDQLLTLREAIAATLSGAMTGGLSMAAGRVAQRLGIEDVDAALAGGRMGVTAENADKGLLRQMLESVLTEGVLEELPQSAQEQMWQNIGEGKPVFEGVGNAAAMGLVAGAVTGVGFNAAARAIDSKSRSSLMAELNAKRLEQLNKIMAANKVLQRDPDAVERFAEQATEQGVKDFYLDAQTLMQSGLGEELAAVSPSVAEQLPTAIATGGQVHLTVSEYTARVAGTELAPRLVDHIRVGDPNGFSRVEAQEYLQTQMADVEAEVAKVLDLKADDLTFRESYQKVKNAVRDRLNELGSFAPHVNEFYATQQAAYAAARASRLGISPEQFYQDHLLRIESERGVGPQYDQNGNVISFRAATSNRLRIPSEADMRTWGREQLINWLQDMDPNGVYADPTPDPNFTLVQAEGQGNRWAVLDESTGEYVDGKVYDTSEEAYAAWRDAAYADAELPPMTQEEALDAALQMRSDAVANSAGEVVQGEFNQSANQTELSDAQAAAEDSAEDAEGDDAGETVQGDVPESVDDAAVLDSAFKTARSKIWNKGRDLKLAIQDAVQAAARAAGVNVGAPSPQTTEYLVRAGLKDALFALEQNPNAIGWYDLKTRQALAVMALVHPEIATDENARFAFTWALAVTSNGIKVDKNFELAEEAYTKYKRDGRMPTDIQAGQAQKAINESLGLFNDLVGKWGIDNTRKFMLTNFTVGEISALSKELKPGGEHADVVVKGAAILGPKIGNGFFSNLYGHFNALTMDRWLVRTWGRWTGTLIKAQPHQTALARTRLTAAVAAVAADQAEAVRLSEILGVQITAGMDVDELSTKVQESSMDPGQRAKLNESALGEEIRKAGNSLAKYLDGQKEAPAGPNERKYIREVFSGILAQLRAMSRYEDLTMADLQAVLWYAEKRLYETAKDDAADADETEGYSDEDAPDYANAAAKVARDKGVSDRKINNALKREADRGRAGNAGSQAGQTGQAAGQQPGAVGGFDRQEKRLWIGELATKRIRSNRAGNAPQPWTYSRASDEGRGGPRLLKSLQVRYLARWSPGRSLSTIYRGNGLAVPKVVELVPDEQNAQRFADLITASKIASGAVGAAVYVYPAADYATMRLFLSEDGKSGVAVKPDGDIVSVFSNGGAGRAMIELAVAAGGTKLDAFNTILPDFYSAHGFRTVARLKWDDEQAPEGWDKAALSRYNNGEPDVVFMVYDPTYMGEYSDQDGKTLSGNNAYTRAVNLQNREQASIAARSQVLNQSAYHGSPHRFPSFSLDFIGTGEGAQAYGWGLYFASVKDVARDYGYALTDINGGPVQMDRTSMIPRARYGSVLDGLEVRTQELKWNQQWAAGGDEKAAKAIPGLEKAIADMKAKANLYAVDIPDEAVAMMLDWDKPLSQQHQNVQKAFKKFWKSLSKTEREQAVFEEFEDYDHAADMAKDPGDLSGRLIYTLMTHHFGSQQLASEYLGEQGVPGTKFLDAGSRGVGEGTQNYVLWDQATIDEMNKSLEKFYQAEQAGNRGSFNPALNLITLLQDADLSTFLHESAHYFFETDIGVVQALLAKPELTPGEQQIVDDVSALLKWHGLEGTPAEQLAAWNAMSFEEKRVAHERTAEAYEHYLFEGKAPSLELESAFRAFTTWMKRVYTSIRDFLARNPEAGKLNDEIRQVFDRMLATDEQIRIAEAAREMAPLFATEEELAKMGLDPAAYQLAQLAATQASMEYLAAKGLKDMKWLSGARGKELKRLQREVAEQRAKMREQVEAEVLQQPIYQAIRWLTKGVLVRDGEEIKAEKGFRLNTATVKAMYPDSVLSKPDLKRLRGMTGPEGLEPDMVAEMFGFASGDALIRAIVEATPMKEEVDGLTDQRMLETYGDLTTKEGLEREADKAVHTELRARVLATESNALDKALGRPRMLAKAAKLAAERTVAKLLVKNVRPKQYGAAEAKAGKAAAKAFKAGDIKTAADEKRRQLFNNYAAKAAYEAQDDVRAILKFFRHIASLPDQKAGKTRNMDVVAAARAILAEHGYGQRTKGALEYLKAVEAYDPQTYQALVEMIADAGDIAPGKPVDEMTVEELRALHDEVKFIWNIAKRTQEVIVDGERRQREDLANELADRLEELGAPAEDLGKASAVTPAEERALRLSSAKAWLRRVEHWVDMLDGSKMGIFRRYVFQPIKEAADRYRADKIVYLRAFRDAFDGIGQTMQKGLIDARELGYTFGKDEAGVGMNELLHAILHTGNESNKRKLLLGRGWATENEDGTLNTNRWDAFLQRMVDDGVLTRDHFDFAQKVWDLLEQTKPLAQKAHRDAYGKYFSEVTANEFTVQFPDGSSAVYRGGYVPAMTDARIVKDAELKKLVEEGNDGVMHAFPGAAKGFTKSRVEYNRPLLLDLRTLPQHIDRVLLFSHLEMPVRDAGKLLANRRLAGTLNRYDAGAISQMLMPWLNRTARQQVTVPVAGAGWMARWINTLRNRTSLASMFANVSNALQQVTGFAMASVKVKPSHLASAMAHYLKNPKAMAETVAANSVYMSHRMENEVDAMMGEVDKILLDPTTYEQTQEWVKRHQFFLQSAVDNVMGPVIWTGAYNEALEEGYSHKDAVRIADSVIRTTQGSTLPEDVSSIEVQNAFLRVFLQFAGYFNMQANLLGGEFGKLMRNGGLRMGMGRGLYVFTMGFLAPAMVAELIAQAFKGGPGDDDKDGEYLDDWLMALLVYGPMRNGTAFVPGAGQLVNSAVARFNSNPTDDRVSTAPAVSMLESAAGVPYDLYREAVDRGNHARTIKDVATLITLTTGLPANTLARPISYLAGVEQGKVQPTSTTDAARGLVTGTPSPESRVQ